MDFDADFYQKADGTWGERRRQQCAHGHDITLVSTGGCKRCRQLTRVFFCDDVHCDGMVTSLAHEAKCPP